METRQHSCARAGGTLVVLLDLEPGIFRGTVVNERLVDGFGKDQGGDELHAPELVIRAPADPKPNR